LSAAVAFATDLRAAVATHARAVDIVVSPSLVNLAHVARLLADTEVCVAAQNFQRDDVGPLHGQVSLQELRQLGVRYMIVGHPELTSVYQGETEAVLARKIADCLSGRISPIVFMTDPAGASDGALARYVRGHVLQLLAPAEKEGLSLSGVVFAYEPCAPVADGAPRRVLV